MNDSSSYWSEYKLKTKKLLIHHRSLFTSVVFESLTTGLSLGQETQSSFSSPGIRNSFLVIAAPSAEANPHCVLMSLSEH